VNILEAVAAFIGCYLIAILIHEIGHIIGALIGGIKVKWLSWMCFLFILDNGFKVKIIPFQHISGGAVMPNHEEKSIDAFSKKKSRLILFTLFGPLVSLLCFLMFFFVNNFLCTLFACANMIVFMVTMIGTDGRVIEKYVKSDLYILHVFLLVCLQKKDTEENKIIVKETIDFCLNKLLKKDNLDINGLKILHMSLFINEAMEIKDERIDKLVNSLVEKDDKNNIEYKNLKHNILNFYYAFNGQREKVTSPIEKSLQIILNKDIKSYQELLNKVSKVPFVQDSFLFKASERIIYL